MTQTITFYAQEVGAVRPMVIDTKGIGKSEGYQPRSYLPQGTEGVPPHGAGDRPPRHSL